MENFYLVHFQYLGFRYHGYAVQPNVKTVQKMIERTINFVLGDIRFKTLVTSRTDAMVSANHSVFELFVEKPIDTDTFLKEFNQNIPPDIRAIKAEQTDASFNIIQNPKEKKYQYFFSYGAEKPHPFSASLIAHFQCDLDIELMKKGAELFLGQHNFQHYCKAPKEGTQFVREILTSEIVENDIYTANFFPEKSFVYNISSKGFMRNQIRFMMGMLLELGKHTVSIEILENSLLHNSSFEVDKYLAPASGLVLEQVVFE